MLVVKGKKRYICWGIGKKWVEEKKKSRKKNKSWVNWYMSYVSHHVMRFIKIKITIVLVHNKLSRYLLQQLRCQIFHMLKENLIN